MRLLAPPLHGKTSVADERRQRPTRRRQLARANRRWNNFSQLRRCRRCVVESSRSAATNSWPSPPSQRCFSHLAWTESSARPLAHQWRRGFFFVFVARASRGCRSRRVCESCSATPQAHKWRRALRVEFFPDLARFDSRRSLPVCFVCKAGDILRFVVPRVADSSE